jgi:YVTN family beta-propeller protein
MDKNHSRSPLRSIVILMITLGLFLFSPTRSGAQEGKAYISSQDGSKLYIVDLSKNSIVKTLHIFTPTALGKALPPNINDVIAVGEKIFMSVPGPEISPAGVNEVKVIDSRSDRVVATLKTGMTPSGLLDYKGRIFVVNRYGNTIQEIDPKTLQIVRTIPFPIPKTVPMNLPLFMEIANDKIYLAFPGGISRPGGIQILDLKTGAALEFIDFVPISNYGPLAIKKVGNDKIYLGGAHNIAILDASTDKITKVISISTKDPYVQSFALFGDKVYAANGVSTVSVIDARSDTFLKEIDIGYHPYAFHLKSGIAATGNAVYVADAGRGLKILDVVADRLSTTLMTEEPLGPIAIIVEDKTVVK